MAREEVVVIRPHPTHRSKSLPEPSGQPASGATSDRTARVPVVAPRYVSVGAGAPRRASCVYTARNRDDPSEVLNNFSFPAPTNEPSTPRQSMSNSNSRTRSSSLSLSPKTRADRKRQSAADEPEPAFTLQKPDFGPELGAGTRDRKNFTREFRYLDLSVWPKSKPGVSRRHSALVQTPSEPNKNNSNATRRPLSLVIPTTEARRVVRNLRRSTSMSKLVHAKSLDPDLKEPTVDDFLALNDDDIADGTNHRSTSRAPTLNSPPQPTPLQSPVWKDPVHPMLTLSPPMASRPATTAAIVAAQIAITYRFDLLYVVNLWPSHISRPSVSSPFDQACGTRVALSASHVPFGSLPCPPESPTSGYDSSSGSSESLRSPDLKITGRLLAAYGLDSVQHPFRISVPANLKALRADDWLEFRNDKAALNEYAVGYSRAFYTGYLPPRGKKGSTNQTDGPGDAFNERKLPANRGIVFSGFRVADSRGNLPLSNHTELQELYRDVEALVDLLILMHKRQGRTATGTGSGTPRRRGVKSPNSQKSPSPSASEGQTTLTSPTTTATMTA
jgi:hypothetical protein